MEGQLEGADALSRPPTPSLRVHQRRALEAIEQAEATGSRRAWVVLPPGAGKTLVGLETARRRGRTTVVLGPNTAIQTQWLRGWDALEPTPASATREIDGPFTALTYQSLATFDDHDTVDDDAPGKTKTLLDGLHPNGRALVERLKQVGDLTLVLDECHHLLEVWGRLLQEVLDQLPDAFVLGLTATPPSTLTQDQKALVDELFGATLFTASIPAVVREGDLAPFAELAWLTTPTPSEADWLAEQGERFAELTTALTDPSYGSTSFFGWLDNRFTQPAESRAHRRGPADGARRTAPAAARRARHRGAPAPADRRRLGAADRGVGAAAPQRWPRRGDRGTHQAGAAVGRLPADQARHPPRPQPRRPGARAQRGQDVRAHRDRAGRAPQPGRPPSHAGALRPRARHRHAARRPRGGRRPAGRFGHARARAPPGGGARPAPAAGHRLHGRRRQGHPARS